MVKHWPWRKLVAGVGATLVLLGMAPLMDLCWWGATHSPRPVSIPLPLKRGEYSSPFFKTDLNESYDIGIDWDGPRGEWKALDIDWRIVDDSNAVLQQGTYNYRLRGNTAALGRYQPNRSLRQRIIVRNRQDAQGLDSARPKLVIDLPERSLDMGYGALYAVRLAFLVSGPGMLILLFSFIAHAIRSNVLSEDLNRPR